MRLVVAPPPGWQVRGGPDRPVAHGPGGLAATLAWTPLVLAPTSPPREPLPAELPPGARVEELSRTTAETTTGWPMLLVDSWVLHDGGVYELRLAVRFAFRSLAAYALLRVRDERVYFGVRQEIMPSLVGAAPDYGATLSCIAQFWAEPDTETSDDPAANPG